MTSTAGAAKGRRAAVHDHLEGPQNPEQHLFGSVIHGGSLSRQAGALTAPECLARANGSPPPGCGDTERQWR